MKLAVVGLILGTTGMAHARPGFDEYSESVAPRPAQQLVEASCELAVELRGAVATFEMRQRIRNPGPGDLAASLELGLPRGAQVTSFALRADPAVAVKADAPSIEGASSVLGVDPAILTRDANHGYRIVLQPLAPTHDALLVTRYVAVAEVRDGALRLVVPARAAATLTTCKGSIRATPGPGASVRTIRINGADSGRARAPFAVHATDVVIEVELAVAGRQPIAWRQTQPLADGWSASLLTVIGPKVKPAGARRVVFLIDGSRSMDLLGRQHVVRVVHQIGAALPKDAEVEAILYDRTATRVFGDVRAATPQNLAVIEAAVATRGASNGSDVVGAFARAREVIDGARGQAMLIVITDGVTGDVDGQMLTRALGAKTSTVDVHAVVLDPATTRSPGANALRAPVNLYGGAFVEVGVDELDEALEAIDEWLRPAWLDLQLGQHAVPNEVRAGSGFTRWIVHRGAARLALTGRGATTFQTVARPAPSAPIGALALAHVDRAIFTYVTDPSDDELAQIQPIIDKARRAHPFADAERSFAVLTTAGTVARSRRTMVQGGGRYERMIAVADPPPRLAAPSVTARISASAISKATLERLFRDQLQPKAYACYQRALGRNAKLVGTAHFQFRMGRGEVTEVQLTGLGDPRLDACLLDAAYQLTPPLPDFAVNADDQTIANYPLTFNRREDQAVVVLGDADSASPLDIDGIEGGVPRRPSALDTRTPLGTMRPATSP